MTAALAALGGMIGIVISAGASVVLAEGMSVACLFDPTIKLFSFMFSAGVNMLCGYLQTLRAAPMDPIEALRHE